MSKIKLVLFDLDDTLYPESEYVRSGFRHVSRCLFDTDDAREQIYRRMMELFDEDKGHVFDNLSKEISILKIGSPLLQRSEELSPDEWTPSTLASWMINEYRNHIPQIKLAEDARSILQILRERGFKVGLVTDGVAAVQKRKVEALGVRDYLDCVIYTDELAPNRAYWKPSPYPFKLALDLFSVQPENACYVGDNPSKDFEGPSKLGMYTVWIRRESGVYASAKIATEPTFRVNSLLELLDIPIFEFMP